MMDAVTPEERYAAIVSALTGRPGVTGGPGSAGPANRFGAGGLKVGGRIFAMLAGGRLVVRLPRERVDALVAAGEGERFDPRRDGRLMREWLAVDPAAGPRWLSLAGEALAFVGPRSALPDLLERVRAVLAGRTDVEEKRMVGGRSFMVAGSLCCGVTGGALMVRVGPEACGWALAQPHVRPLELAGRRPAGYVCVDLEGVPTDEALAAWVRRGVDFVSTLQPGRSGG